MKNALYCITLIATLLAFPSWCTGSEKATICGNIKQVEVRDHRFEFAEGGPSTAWLNKYREDFGSEYREYYYVWMLFPDQPSEYEKLHLIIDYKKYPNVLNKPVCVCGGLSPAVTGWHKTKTMMTVTSITPNP